MAGAGGGFDIFNGIPLYFKLREVGKEVILANLSFAALAGSRSKQLTPSSWQITDDSYDFSYFPEKQLYDWLKTKGIQQTIIGFEKTGVIPLYNAYQNLVEEYEIDTIILIDGGTDGLMKGDETGLGTPGEDACTIAAVNKLKLDKKFLLCIGFGVDAYHGICHAQYLENTAALIKKDSYLGCFAFNPKDEAVQQFIELVKYANEKNPDDKSIVANSIKDSFSGEFGNFHSTHRTRLSKLFINPLMGIYWIYELTAIAEMNLYLKYIEDTHTFMQLTKRILDFRNLITPKDWQAIPH